MLLKALRGLGRPTAEQRASGAVTGAEAEAHWPKGTRDGAGSHLSVSASTVHDNAPEGEAWPSACGVSRQRWLVTGVANPGLTLE